MDSYIDSYMQKFWTNFKLNVPFETLENVSNFITHDLIKKWWLKKTR